MNQQIHSRHSPDSEGVAHSHGATIVWGEDGHGARPETVLRMVLDRVEYLQDILPCDENVEIIASLQQALQWEQIRNDRRSAQGVQGTNAPHRSDDEVHTEPTVEGDMGEEVQEEHEPPNPDLADEEEHPHPLDVAIPSQDGRFFAQSVLRSFELQDIPYRLWTSTKYSNGEFALARNNVRVMSLQGTSPYILMSDNDLVFPEGAWRAMIEFLEANRDFAAIAISKHGDPDPSNPGGVVEPGHVDAGPVMFRREVFQHFEYSNIDGRCECGSMCITIRQMHRETFQPIESENDTHLAWRIGFLTGWAVRHIMNTRLD